MSAHTTVINRQALGKLTTQWFGCTGIKFCRSPVIWCSLECISFSDKIEWIFILVIYRRRHDCTKLQIHKALVNPLLERYIVVSTNAESYLLDYLEEPFFDGHQRSTRGRQRHWCNFLMAYGWLCKKWTRTDLTRILENLSHQKSL